MRIDLIKEDYKSLFVIGKESDPDHRILKTTSTWIALVNEKPFCFICKEPIENEGIFCHARKKFYCFDCEAKEISPCLKFLNDSEKEHIDTICIIKVEENA